MKKTLFLALVLLTTGIGHANLGDFCSEDKKICYSLNANNKAVATLKVEIATIKTDFSRQKDDITLSFAGTYARSGDKISVNITDVADKNAFLTYIKKYQLQNYNLAIMTGCEGLVNRRAYPATATGVQKCLKDFENAPDAKLAKQQINERKVGDDIYNKTLKETLKVVVGEFALIENSLHRLDEHCQSTQVFTKPSTKPSSFNLYCSGDLLKKREEFTDSRDGKKYIYVTIGNQTWMAQNLNYHGKDGYLGLCRDKRPENCEKEGRLYDWSEAMGIGREYNKKKWGKNSKLHQGVCPDGWNLPGDKEWKTLLDFSGGKKAAGKKLGLAVNSSSCKNKTQDDRGRVTEHNECPTNEYGFSGSGYWWSTEEKGEYNAVNWGIDPDFFKQVAAFEATFAVNPDASSWDFLVGRNSDFSNGDQEKEKMQPIRCIKKPSEAEAEAMAKADAEAKAKAEANKGTFTDSRDKKTYKTVKIGGKTWMAENLNYGGQGFFAKLTSESKCYDNKSANCDKYGRLYNLETAKAACPKGWHIPSDTEWDKLIETAGGNKYLKAKSGWSKNDNGTDDSGFSALPGGYGNSDDNFYDAGSHGYWWSVSEIKAGLYNKGTYILSTDFSKSYDSYDMYSVRCVQD